MQSTRGFFEVARVMRVVPLAFTLLAGGSLTADAGYPHGANYCAANDRIFWFVHISDPHIGASGSTDTDRLRWVVTTARSVIDPAFIVATGDLTDSTNGNIFGYPNGPYQAEWDQYKSILDGANAGPAVFYDVPGNHDAYSDRYFTYYKANSVQGRATGSTQVSWTRTFPFGTYHFLGINSADNSGAAFSLAFPYGDHAGLDADELLFIHTELDANLAADLTLVFGHHPVTDTGAADDTWLFYGQQDFIAALDTHAASLYGYGHTHDSSRALFEGNEYTGLMGGDGIHYYNVASLGKSSGSNFSVIAIDCNGLSSVTQATNTWPVVLITAPVDAQVGGVANPYSYPVPVSAANPIRALVFDANAVTQVSYRLDGAATWTPMMRVVSNAALWEAIWNASSVATGPHTLEVRAVGTTTRSHTITVNVTGGANRAPVAVDDVYMTMRETELTVDAPGVVANDTDADNDQLKVSLVTPPAHGSLTLNADGSLTYAPAAGYVGADSFTYKASDAVADSNTATVSITVNAPPVADTVTITAATYKTKTKTLSVTATSSAAPRAVLTVMGFGTMTYSSKSKRYSFSTTTSPGPASVTVQSDKGGSATRAVSTR